MKKVSLYLIAFLAVVTQCENWGMISGPVGDPWGRDYTHPRCIEENHYFETKKELVDFLKGQDDRMHPHHRAYEVKPIEYELSVGREWGTVTIEEPREIETKREIKFK